MNHRIRPGVVLKELCGEYLLLATLDAAQHCPYVYQINETAAFFWQLLAQQLPEDEIVAKVAAEYEAPEADIRRDLGLFTAALQQQGYLLSGEGEG